MIVNAFYCNDGINILNLETSILDAEKSGVDNLCKLYMKGELICDLKELNYKDKALPVLLVGKKSNIEHVDLTKLNCNEIISKLDFESFYFNGILNEFKLKANKDRYIPFSISYKKTSYGKLTSDLLLASFYHGEVLAIFPNPYTISITKDEYIRDNCSKKFKTNKINEIYGNEGYIEKLKERSNSLFNKAKDIIQTMYNSYKIHGFLVRNASSVYSNGMNIFYIPKNDYQIILNYRVFPYILKRDNIVRKDKALLEKEIEKMKLYIEEENKQLIELKKIKEKLKKAGKSWFTLNKIRKDKDGNWKVWLNPCKQNLYNHGWFTLKDLEDWAEDKGVIVKNIIN